MDRGGEETAPGMEGGSLIPPPPPKRVKREKLAVARTALPKGHSLKVVGQESQPGRLETRPIPELFGSSSVLAKVRNFLPQLKGANEDLNRRLQAEDPKQFDVEYISDDEKPHVEMNIALVSDDDSEDEAEDATGTPSVLLSRTLSSAKKKPGMIEVLCDSADEAESWQHEMEHANERANSKHWGVSKGFIRDQRGRWAAEGERFLPMREASRW